MRIACLHTIDSNVPVFEAARAALGLDIELRHQVRDDYLKDAERAGGLTAQIAARAAESLEALGADADAVLLTCSTLGPSIAGVAEKIGKPVLRVDGALAEAAVRKGGRVVVLCAVETTIEPTRMLFDAAAASTGATIEMRLVPDAWPEFKAGRLERYFALVAAAADRAAAEKGVSAVALAQASMAGAAQKCRLKPLTSPAVGLAAASAAAQGRRAPAAQ